MLLRKLCQQFGNIQLRRCSTRVPHANEPIPKPLLLRVSTDRWQKRHMKELKKLVLARQISEAITYFYREIKTPNINLFSVMLGGVGKTGHTELAFRLLKDMRSRNIRPTPACLTSLFNACGNNRENRHLALTSATSLYEKMTMQGWRRNEITYHAMIKAFAMHGDTATCFKLLDEMSHNGHAVTADTYTHLMMACVGDKNMGFVLAVRVMRHMLWNRIKPTVICYNNLLRAAVECGCGGNIDLLNKLLNDAKHTQLKDPHLLQVSAGDNLLDTKLSDSLVSVSGLPKDVSEKLALIGGTQGILKQMSYFELKPTSSTYSMLLRCITTEDELLQFLESIPVFKLDTGFWNQLLKKCIFEHFECTDEVEEKFLRRKDLDIVSYGILALRVETPESVREFLDRLENKSIMPNEVIMSTLIKRMSLNFHFKTLLKLLKYCKDNDIDLNRTAVQSVADMLNKNRNCNVNCIIERALKRVKVLEDEHRSRLQQFEPVVVKRNKRRWDPEAEDDEIEEMDRILENEAELTRAAKERRRLLQKKATVE